MKHRTLLVILVGGVIALVIALQATVRDQEGSTARSVLQAATATPTDYAAPTFAPDDGPIDTTPPPAIPPPDPPIVKDGRIMVG